jgi:CheY-like chemotaxis protein
VAKILVADDNSNIQKMVGLALKDQGIEVVAVGNGEAAVRKISDLRPDLVLADVFMPVRSGYEVCSYVKQDPTLAHIPVILLVGAFDPLDEQEAQRVGADGVLKKPFVPPDPLISMVKSALARAGVSIGPAAAVEKTLEISKRNAADLLSTAVPKLAALAPAKLPEVEPDPLPEDLPSFVTEVRIAAGQEPVAFGSLLETPEPQDDVAFVPAQPPTEIGAAHEWEKDEVEEEEEAEEETETPGNGWRPGGDLDKHLQEERVSNAAPDWREEAFHGHSPAKPHPSQRWAPNVAEPAFAEASSSLAVAVSTVEEVKPAETTAFSGDAWAAAMAAGVEEKLSESSVAEKSAPETVAIPGPEVSQRTAQTYGQDAPVQHEVPAEVESAHSAHINISSPWDLEAKKAKLLAATWQSVASEGAHSDSNGSAPLAESASIAPAADVVPTERVNDTQEIEAYRAPDAVHQESTWVPATPEVVNQFVETPAQEFAAAHEEQFAQTESPAAMTEQITESATAPAEEAAPAMSQPKMDDLVARVLFRMNPDILQKVTREILKPVIEAIIQDELNSKKQ